MKEDDLIRNINPFGLRMQPALRAKVEEAAKQNHRSLNAEIVARLEETFSAPSIKGRERFVIQGESNDWALTNVSALLRAAALHYERRADVISHITEAQADIEDLQGERAELLKEGKPTTRIDKQIALLEGDLKMLLAERERIEETLPSQEVRETYLK